MRISKYEKKFDFQKYENDFKKYDFQNIKISYWEEYAH